MNAVAEINAALVQLVEKTKLCNTAWPDNATHAAVYNTKCWPCDWTDDRVVFFTSLDEVIAWKARHDDWQTLEDNYYEATYYEWDWGPHQFYLEASMAPYTGDLDTDYPEFEQNRF